MKNNLILILIFLLAIVLRFYNLGDNPTFISDEASIGYNAYSVSVTGKDEWGNILPISFKSFGEYKLPGYIYSAVIPIKILGLNEFSTRFPSALFGSLTVVLVFFLSKNLFTAKVGLVSAFLMAISPWHIQMSRLALEANLSLFLVVLGAWMLIRHKDRFWPYLSLVPFALSLYTYNTCRIFVPIFIILYLFIYRKEFTPRKIILSAAVFILLIFPLFFTGFSGSRERLYKVGIFNDIGTIADINRERGDCLKRFSEPICVLRYNKPVTYAYVYTRNYFSHFSWRYLFSNGSGLAQYQMPNFGSLYVYDLPLLLIGIYVLFKKRQILLFAWILSAPLANSLTGQAHPVRAIFMLPVFQIIASIGAIKLSEIIGKQISIRKISAFVFAALVSFSLTVFVKQYFYKYPSVTPWIWQSGYKNLYLDLHSLEDQYQKIYVSKYYGEPHIFYLFYSQYNPKDYQEGSGVVRYDRNDLWVNVDQIGKYYFVQKPEEIKLNNKEILVSAPEENISGKVIKMIKYKNGEPAFVIQNHEEE